MGQTPFSSPPFSLSVSFQVQSAAFFTGTISWGEARWGRETSQGKGSCYEKITVDTGKPSDKGEGTTETELRNWLSIYVFQNTVSRYPTSQGDKKESFSVKACYISKKACWYFARTEQEGSIPRAAQQRISLTPCPVTAWGSLDFCFLSLPLLQLPRVMEPSPLLRVFCGGSSCVAWPDPHCRGKCWLSTFPQLLNEDNDKKESCFFSLQGLGGGDELDVGYRRLRFWLREMPNTVSKAMFLTCPGKKSVPLVTTDWVGCLYSSALDDENSYPFNWLTLWRHRKGR